MRLKELKNWLRRCSCPDRVINRSFYNANLQISASFTDNLKNIPFLTSCNENKDNKIAVRKICKYVKITILFFHKSNPRTFSDC